MTPRFWSLNSLLAGTLAIIAAVAAAVVVTAGGDNPDTAEAQIIAASEVYLDAAATGDVPALTRVVCAAEMRSYPGPSAEPTPKRLITVADIVISGDSATGAMMIVDRLSPESGSSLIPMTYVNEDGWKLCPPTSQE